MEITAIFGKVRKLLSDQGYNSNSDNSDQLWDDDTLIGHLNMALMDFDFKTNSKQISYDDIAYHFDTVVDQEVYDLPSDILRVSNVTCDNQAMYETSYNINHCLNGEIVNSHRPEFYSLNYENNKIRFSSKPDAIYTIKFRGVVAQDQFTLSNLNLELPLPAKYHEFFKYYIASKCLEFRDIDSNSLQDAQYFMGQWNQFCRQVKLEISRRTTNIIGSTNGIYNTW